MRGCVWTGVCQTEYNCKVKWQSCLATFCNRCFVCSGFVFRSSSYSASTGSHSGVTPATDCLPAPASTHTMYNVYYRTAIVQLLPPLRRNARGYRELRIRVPGDPYHLFRVDSARTPRNGTLPPIPSHPIPSPVIAHPPSHPIRMVPSSLLSLLYGCRSRAGYRLRTCLGCLSAIGPIRNVWLLWQIACFLASSSARDRKLFRLVWT
jgi:hypothetical protein